MFNNHIHLVECPRDAIQGISHFISTDRKINYINQLIASSLFEYIDFGSLVSPKAVPQMKDTLVVLDGLEKNTTKLLTIVVNEKGAEIAEKHSKIDYLGYPFSISETFQKRNANSTINESYERVKNIKEIITDTSQELVVYISMAFGNPYGDEWSLSLVLNWIEKLASLGINRFSIADTTSEASPIMIQQVFSLLFEKFKNLDFSIHLHSKIESSLLKINAAYEVGCTRFEGAFLGYGGCPFAKDDLVGNIPTEMLLTRFGKSSAIEMSSMMNSFQELIKNNEL